MMSYAEEREVMPNELRDVLRELTRDAHGLALSLLALACYGRHTTIEGDEVELLSDVAMTMYRALAQASMIADAYRVGGDAA